MSPYNIKSTKQHVIIDVPQKTPNPLVYVTQAIAQIESEKKYSNKKLVVNLASIKSRHLTEESILSLYFTPDGECKSFYPEILAVPENVKDGLFSIINTYCRNNDKRVIAQVMTKKNLQATICQYK